jgi:hypothetical protein
MYGDTSAIRGLARAMRERADEIRAQGDALAARHGTATSQVFQIVR